MDDRWTENEEFNRKQGWRMTAGWKGVNLTVKTGVEDVPSAGESYRKQKLKSLTASIVISYWRRYKFQELKYMTRIFFMTRLKKGDA